MAARLLRPGTLPAAILAALADHPDLSYSFHSSSGEEQIAAGELARRIGGFAAAFRDRGLGGGRVLPLFAPSSAALWAAFVGAMAADLVPCILPAPTFKTHTPTWVRNLRALLARYGIDQVVGGAEARRLVAPAFATGAHVELLALEELDRPAPPPEAAETRGDGIAFLQHSSGSTGTPKGVALTHEAVLGHLAAYAEAIGLRPGSDRIASWLPLYHDMGLVTSFLMPLVHGVGCDTVGAAEWVVDPARILAIITERRSTLAWWPNFTYNLLAQRVRPGEEARYDLASVRRIVNCSEPVLAASHQRLYERLAPAGLRADALQTCYALAENVFAATQSRTPGPAVVTVRATSLEPGSRVEECAPETPGSRRVMSSGVPIPGVRLEVVDAERRACGEGRVGEVALSGPSLFSGYLRLPELTAAVLQDGVFYTGDVAFLRGGELFVLGRGSDLIVVGGRKFYPNDVEQLVNEVEGVKDGRVVAFGVPNDEKGTQDVVVMAESELHGDGPRAAALRKEIRSRVLQRLDCTVDAVVLLPAQSLVKTSSGKVARADNRRRYLEARPAEPPAG